MTTAKAPSKGKWAKLMGDVIHAKSPKKDALKSIRECETAAWPAWAMADIIADSWGKDVGERTSPLIHVEAFYGDGVPDEDKQALEQELIELAETAEKVERGELPEPLPDHPAAALFPLLEGDAFEQLKTDIKLYGQRDPIVVFEGKVLDGRNRFRACDELGIEPEFTTPEIDDREHFDPVAYVLSTNLHRRHLTESQRAMVAARAKKIYTEQAKGRQKQSKGRGKKGSANLRDLKGKASDKAGTAVNVSGRSVDAASKVLARGTPELVEAVDAGNVAVSAASKLADLPKPKQVEAIKGGKAAIKAAIDSVKPKEKPLKVYHASDSIDFALGQVVAILHRIDVDYGGWRKMITRNDWQKHMTVGIVQLLRAVHDSMSELIKEIDDGS